MSVMMDTEPQRLRGFEKGRFEALVDVIFAAAPTLLVLGITFHGRIDEHIDTTPAATADLHEK